MADQAPQNFKNHTRFDPKFHFVLVPIFAGNLVYRIYELVRYLMNPEGSWTGPVGAVVIAFGLLLLMFTVRLYSLKVQTRVIRLEERLRLGAVLPEALRVRIPELTESQLVGLRFASDEEVTELVRATLDKTLDNKAIKQSIRNWRPDHFRV